MQVAARTEIGYVRTKNEDALLVAEEDRVLAVFDGLGGHPAGEVASEVAADSLRGTAAKAATSVEELVTTVHTAHDAVVAAAGDDPDREDMATTAVVATLGDDTAIVAHVGDSRAYLLDPDGRLQQVTRDHGMGGYITQALGLDRGVSPDVTEVPTPPGSRLLLCTDGLSNMLPPDAIRDLLAVGGAQDACDALVAAALERGGIDNVTVIVAVF